MWFLLGALALGLLRWRLGGSWQRWLGGALALALCALGLPLAQRALNPPADPHAGHWSSHFADCARGRRGCWARALATSQRPHSAIDYGSLTELTQQDLIDQVLSGGVKEGYVFEVAPTDSSE
ncbi:MAG TPA: hypothetical protein DEA08_15775 [Planctomycetes bacterium]|nr:hypothetical protein [Planctomycetota bacterium]